MPIQTYIAGSDVTQYVQDGSCTHQWSRPTFATVRMPSQVTTADETSRCKVYLDGVLDFHGICVMIEDQGDENEMWSTFTFADPTVLFEMRPARDGAASGDPGDFSKPSFMVRNVTGPAMIHETLVQSLDGSNPAKGEGPMGVSLGTFDTGGADLRGQPADFPMTIAQVIGYLVDTGEVEVEAAPIDVGGNMALFNAWNAGHGSDLSGSVSFEYGLGQRNATGCRRTLDLSGLMNKLWIYLGPRKGTKLDPPGDQHWAANITGTSSLPDPPMTQILNARSQSQTDFFVRMAIRIFDGDESQLMLLYQRWWQMEQWVRLRPQKTIAITPNPGIRPAFKCGDKIHVAAGSAFRGGFSGTQRVMEYTYRWDKDGKLELGEPVGAPGVPAVHVSDTSEGI